MPNKITYTIKTADGKEHQVSKENIDKHGIQAYADAYEGATIRMRDSKKGDYDIPLSNYNDAKAQGLHAFSWEHKPVVAQNNPQATQKQPAPKVNTTPGTPMTAAQKAQVLDNTNNLIAQSQSAIGETILKNKVALDRTKKPFSNINNITLGRKNSGSIGSDKVKEHTINGKKVYSDDKGNIYDSKNSAVSEVQERMIDRDGLSKRIAALSVENENANKRLSEIREKYQKQLNPTQIYGQNGTAGNFNALDKLLENDDEYMMLLTTTRNNQRSLDILRNKQQENNDNHDGVNVFWRSTKSLGRGMRDYFKTDFDPTGDATGKDALAYMRAEKIVETLSKKLQTGETLSTKEKATLALFNSYNQQQDISGDDSLSSWMYSGGRGVSLSAEFGAMIASGAGAFQTIAEKTAQGASKAALSQITKYLGKGVAKNIGTKIATKAVGSVAGMMSSGLAYTSTVGFKKTFANAMQNYVGEMGVTKDGQIAFGEYVKDKEGKVSFKRKDGGITDLVTAFAKAGYEQTKENGTEMLGETLPSITKILKGIGGTAKFVSKLEKIGATPFVESINKALRMTGYNGLPSQGIEEYAGLLSDVIFSDASLKDFGKLQTHLDIWGNVALTSGVMSSVQVAGIGTGAAMFYKYKHQNDKAGKKAQALIGDKWNGIQEVLDNTANAEFSGALAGILSREDLNGEQKKRVVNYANSLLKMRGFNIGFNNDKMGSSGEKGIDGAISEVSYAAGYNATEDELANIKNELELRHRQLTQTFKDDPTALQQIEEDPKAFLQGLKESEVGGEKAKVINAYEESRAAYDGMIQRVKDNIDDAITENNTVIEQRTHQDGNIYPATMKLDDRKVYVIKGDVQMNDDGKGIDHEKSSSSVMVRDAETGKIEMVDPSAILSVDTPVNAEEEKATSSEQIRQTYAQEQANKIDGVLEFKAGDTYSIIGEDKKQHTIQIVGEAIDEKTKQPNPDMVMASIDGLEPTMLSKEQIQAMNNEENLWRLDQSLKQGEDVENEPPHSKQSYGYQKKITLTNENGNLVRGEIVSGQNEDGRFEVQTEEPVNGKTVNHLTAEELDAMHAQIQEEQTNQAPVQGEQMESPALVSGMNDGTIAENATVQKEETPQHEPTALERIPTNEQGEPIYEQADPETAWDAIVEQTEGDESIAQSVADGMVADMEAAVRRAEKAKVKGGTTIAEKIAAEKERVATIEQAKATLEHWKKIASTNSRRQEAIQAEESRKAKEAALLRKEQEEKERAMREEEERVDSGRSRSEQSSGGSQEEVTERNSHLTEKEAKNNIENRESGKRNLYAHNVDMQGNLLDENGELKLEKVNSIDDITDDDFNNPTRNIELPAIPQRINDAIGADGKGVIIKKNIFEKNKKSHRDLTPTQSRDIIKEALYNATLYGQNQKGTRPYNWILIHNKDKNSSILIEVNNSKNKVEVINWHYLNDKSLERKKRQAIREGGRILTLESAVANTSEDLSSAGKVSETSNTMQENAEKSSENETTRVETNPTEAQKEAGNYKKGHIKVDGMNITIEQPKGSIRRGKDASGKEWESEMHNTYGYIRGTEGVDGDHIDIFLSENPNEGNVFVVDQVNKDGSFDEHKVMYGFADKESARQAYLSNYEDGWQGLGNITEVSKEEFKKWIGSSKRKTKPFAEYKGIQSIDHSQKEQLKSTQGKEGNEQDFEDKKELEDFVASTDSNNRTKIDESKYDAEDLFAPLLLDGKPSNLAVMTLVSDNINDPVLQIAVYDYSSDIDNKTNSGWQKWGDLADEYNAHVAEEDRTWERNDNAMLGFKTVDAAVKFNDWLKSKEEGKSNVVHSFGNSASQNDTSIKLSDTSFAKMENGEQKAEREIGWLVDHNIRLEENSRKLDEIAHLLFDGDNIDSNRESTLREEAKKILEENEKLSRDYQKNYSDKYFGTDDITANYILQEANERLIALGVKPVKESYYFQNRKNEVAQNAVVHLLKRIGIPVHFITRVGAEASGQENSRGWTNGLDIWLTKDNINAETPVHEYTHIWTFALMKKNPKLWAEIKNLLKDSEWVDAIQSMDEYKYTLDNEDLLYSEVLSHISGERNGEKFESMAFKLIEEVNSVEKKVDLKRGLEKLRDALKRFWEWVGVNLFGMKEFKSVDDVCDRVLFDLLNASDIARTEEMREYYEEEREMNTIIDKAKEDGTYLKTPNGEDTKLPEKVWAYARTKKFKTQLSDRLNLILNESKEDFKDWEKEEFRDLFKKHDLLEENNEPGRFLVSQFMYSEKYYDRKGKMQEEAKETMNSGKGGENVSSVKSVDMRDAEYIKAVENNDTETIQRLLSEEAERKGYSNDSSYQGSLAFNGSAPYQNAYFETKEERKEAWENDEYEDTMSLGDYVDSGIDTNNLEWNLTDPMALRQADPERREAIENLRQTVRSNSKTITIYRAVDANIKENEIRNGDWVTPSRSYAEYHIGLQDWENGRIIEQEVSIDDLWWDGNDIAEWGYDNGKGEVYKNTPNNRKMFEVTYDDKGNIIPLSERFNEENDDIRYRYEEGDNDVALQVKQPIEQSKNLVALHNLSEEKLQQALELGGFPMPSIAITKANIGHTEFGNISLLFGKDSINPTDKRNKVYGGDAWTPTFPSIGYKLNSEKTSDIYRRANNVGSLPLFRPVFFHPDNYENKIDGQGSNGLVEHFKDDYGAKQMFLYEKGNAVEKFVQHEVEKYSDENVKFFEKILEIIGLEKLKNESYDSLENEMKKLLGQYYDIDFDAMKPFRVINRINSTIQKTIDYAENGNNKIENDIAATEEKIDERIDPKEFRKWLEKLFSGVVEKKGIRNKQDMFTPSGNRREWEKLYDAVTLDNAIKAMQTQAKKGGTGLFGGSIFGAASKELKEIEDIRNEAKLRINPISEEDYQAEKDRITERLKKVTIPSVSKSFSDAMDFVENVQDAVSKSHTAKGIYRHLHSLYPDMTMEVAKEIEDIVKDIQKISTRYLEAKPYRAVSFDEIKAAVVPSDTSSELIQQLKDRGIEVSTYEKDNQEQRKQIVNEVASKEELLFRNDDGIDVVNERFNEELDNLTEENADKVTLWLGKPSNVLLSSGIENKPLKLYGNKVIKKMKKHGFALDELRDLPKAVADPIAVFDNLGRFGNRSILTELTTEQGNFLVTIDMGKGEKDVDFNIVSSVFGKGKSKIVSWIERGLATYINKKKALNYLHHSAPIAEALSNSRLSSAANIVKSFENPTNSSEKVLDRKTAQAEEVAEKEHQQMAERANELAETLHLDNVEIVTDASTLEGKKAKAKGFYSTSTGKITIVIPNHSNIADVEKTLLHEAVAHHGLRKLFGEHFDNFLDNVFKNASEDVRREIVKLAAKNKWDFRIATEEYLASLAEDTNFEKMPNGFWDKVKRLFLDMLRSIGLLKQKDGELNDNELRYILWRSYKNLKEKGQSNNILNKAEDIAMQHRLKVGNYSESTDKEVRFRDGEPQSKERVSAAERYEQRVSRSMFQSQEALQDSMLGLKEAMNAIMRAEGKEMYMEDIEGFENAYLGENRLSSVNQAETEAFAHLVFKPMLDEVAKLAKNDKERSELTDYMMAKHGLERNEVMRKNALEEIVNNEKLSDAQKNARASIAEHRDYAGLTALTDANSVEEAESEAQRMVEEYEQKHDTTNLWDKVNTVTKGILSKSYECGMMNKQTYEKVRDMYQFYIPLRGFDEETSREAYAYLSHGQSAFNAPIKTAKGRSSKADDPFANMQSMAESAIMQGNRNVLVKQKFLNFALNHPSDLVSVNALWLKYDDVKEEWRPVFPDNIEETDTADEVEKKIQDFEQRMAELAKQDPERYKHGKDTENIPYRIVESRDLRQHQVVVKRNGRDYVLTINGNPRAAQALNGLTNPDNDVSGAIGAILNFGEKINRQLSAFYTTRNPDFVVSNFIRDMLYANSIVWVKERPNYALRFHRNIGRCNPAQMKILLSKHKKGELDMNNSLEHMFHQFIMNGGETGYANVRDIEQHKNDIQRELKRANGKIGIKRSLSLLGEKLDEYNRAVENCARFAAFLTSREMGRTIDRSIYDAKDISVNFNKKGSGAKFMKATGQTKLGKTSAFISGIGRSGYVFWNAAIQGTTNFGRQFKRHPAKAFTASATMFILGALIAGMGMGDDGDDDKNSYWNLPESVRRSNILFRTGDQWISIPLPVEYRSIYGMGELMISAMSGKEHFTDAELGKAIAGQATQILPIDFLEGEGGVKAFVPSAVKPFAEVISNKGWTGMPIYKDTPYNKNMPEWTKTYKSANKYLIGLAKTLNEVTGGDAYTKGAVNINPAQIEYLLNGYFGGVSNTIDKLTKSAETIAGKRDYDPKSFLLLNRVLKSGDERTEERAINREYYRLKEEYEILRDRLKNYEHDTDEGVFDFSEKINFLYNSPEYARYEIFEDYRGDIESLYKELKEPMSDEERASLEAELTGLKKQMIEEMNSTRK